MFANSVKAGQFARKVCPLPGLLSHLGLVLTQHAHPQVKAELMEFRKNFPKLQHDEAADASS